MASLEDLNMLMEIAGEGAVSRGADATASKIDNVRQSYGRMTEYIGRIGGRVNYFAGTLASFGVDSRMLANKLGLVAQEERYAIRTATGEIVAGASRMAATLGAAAGGAKLGAMVGSFFGPWGTAIGGVVGTAVGAVLGAVVGEAAVDWMSQAGDWLHEAAFGVSDYFDQVQLRENQKMLAAARNEITIYSQEQIDSMNDIQKENYKEFQKNYNKKIDDATKAVPGITSREAANAFIDQQRTRLQNQQYWADRIKLLSPLTAFMSETQAGKFIDWLPFIVTNEEMNQELKRLREEVETALEAALSEDRKKMTETLEYLNSYFGN